jgi:WD40 repeat protein
VFYSGGEILHETTLSLLGFENGAVVQLVLDKRGGRLVDTGSSDNTATLWSAKFSACLRTLRGHGGSVNSASFSLDGALVVSSADDSTAKLWSAESGECLRTRCLKAPLPK